MGNVLSFADKFFTALGAGDGDLTLTPGDTDILPALGAIKIPVLPVLEPIQQHQKPAVFPIPLIGIPGEAAENRPDQKDIGYRGKDQLHQRHGY